MQGVARLGANTDAECREPEPGLDPRVLAVEPIEFTSGGREEAYLWVERVLGAQKYQERAGRGAGLPAESDRIQRGADAVERNRFMLTVRLENAVPFLQ